MIDISAELCCVFCMAWRRTSPVLSSKYQLQTVNEWVTPKWVDAVYGMYNAMCVFTLYVIAVAESMPNGGGPAEWLRVTVYIAVKSKVHDWWCMEMCVTPEKKPTVADKNDIYSVFNAI